MGITPPFGPTLTLQPCLPPSPKQSLRLANIKPANKQYNFVTVNYSVTLKLGAK